MLLFPEDIQEIIAASFSQIAQQDYRLKEILNNLKTLGTDVILAFHKSKRKQRKYDKNPVVHKAMNDLMVISPENQVLLAHRTLELMDCLRSYLKMCTDFGALPQKETLRVIATAYVNGGINNAKAQLDQINQEFTEQNSTRTTIAPSCKKETLPVSAHLETSGTRIRGNLLDI